MQIGRLFEIVYLLMERKSTTAKELAQRFEVSTRTILRDIDTLSAAGIPVYTTQGKGGGIAIMDHFVLNKTTLSEEDQHQILFALQSLASTEQLQVKGTLSRLQSFFQKSQENWIEVDFSRWGNSGSDKLHFELLKNAILQCHAISFQYPTYWGQFQERTVYPLKLIFKSKSWYLQAYCLSKKDYRTFKISRILSLSATEQVFSREEFNPPPIESTAYMSENQIRLRLLFSPQAAYRLFDEFDAESISKQKDGSYLVTLELPDDDWLYGFLMTFGTSLQVLEPPFIRERLLLRLEEMKKKYETIL